MATWKEAALVVFLFGVFPVPSIPVIIFCILGMV